MALASCPGCNKPLTDVDAVLSSCVNCGYVFTPEEREHNRKTVVQKLKARTAEEKRQEVYISMKRGIALALGAIGAAVLLALVMIAVEWYVSLYPLPHCSRG